MTGNLPLFDPFKALAEIRRENAASTDPELSKPGAKSKNEMDQRLDPSFATFATFAGGSSAHGLASARVKEEERKNYLLKSCTYARDDHAHEQTPAHAAERAAKVAKAARAKLSRCNQTEGAQTAVAKVSGEGLRKWHSALAALSPERAPCPGYRGDEWPRTLARAVDFLDTFGQQAVALGWTASRLFGVHPTAGIFRVDACGALVLPSAGTIRAITATEISFGHLTHREKPGQPQGVPIWEFGR